MHYYRVRDGMSSGEPRREREADGRDDGVDVTLIRWMLSLTPSERLDVLQNQLNAMLEVRERNSAD